MSNKTVQTISELAETVLADSEFFLVDVELKGGNTPVVWVYVDAEEKGVNMDECARLSNELGFLLDAHDIFKAGYRLNVSSPGLSRPLSDRRQYPKNKGRKSRVKFRSEEGSYETVEGILSEISDDAISLEKEEGNRLKIPFEQVVETKIIPSI
ncbi:MAG: ribosome maturation factor [Balneolaceae bacterium]|nr:ribosome maturation factor [Balneolaceae bacterium]